MSLVSGHGKTKTKLEKTQNNPHPRVMSRDNGNKHDLCVKIVPVLTPS